MLVCTPAHDGYAVKLDCDSKVALPNHKHYRVESTEVRLLRVMGGYVQLVPNDGLVVLPPSRSPVKCYLQMAVKYRDCPDFILSDICEVNPPALRK